MSPDFYSPGVGASHREAQCTEGFLDSRVSWAVQERLCRGGLVSRVEASGAGRDTPQCWQRLFKGPDAVVQLALGVWPEGLDDFGPHLSFILSFSRSLGKHLTAIYFLGQSAW